MGSGSIRSSRLPGPPLAAEVGPQQEAITPQYPHHRERSFESSVIWFGVRGVSPPPASTMQQRQVNPAGSAHGPPRRHASRVGETTASALTSGGLATKIQHQKRDKHEININVKTKARGRYRKAKTMSPLSHRIPHPGTPPTRGGICDGREVTQSVERKSKNVKR